MNTDYLLLLLLFPLAWPFIAKRIWSTTINWAEMGLQIAIPTVLIIIIYLIGGYGATADTEIWNGQVTEKKRVQDYWLETYQCNCRSVSCGKDCTTTVCDTCYRDHYTVDWYLNTTIGKIRLKYLDRTSRSVYNTPNPAHYTAAYVNEPCSREVGYTNYIKAVPESLFNTDKGMTFEAFAELIPSYPQVHSYYKINRVLPVGVGVPNAAEMNDQLNNSLRVLGPQKQANIIVIVVNTADQTYKHALEEAWLGGKKNDVIVVIGSTNYPTIDWVDTITLGQNAGNSLMTVEMRDNLMAIGTLEDSLVVANSITMVIADKFDRKAMADYEYLKDEIDPPLWAIIIALVLGIGGSLGLTVLFHHKDFFENRYRRY